MHVKADTPRRYHHGDLRNACVRAALQLLENSGLDALTLRAVAERAGVSRSAPYRHFKTKRALLADTAEEGYRRLIRVLQSALDDAGNDGDQRLIAGCVAYARFGAEHPRLYRLMFTGDFGEGPLFDAERTLGHSEYPTLMAAGDAAYDLLIGALVDAQTSGRLRNCEPRRQAVAVWSAIHGVMSLYLDNRTGYARHETAELETVVREVLTVMIEGLGVDNAH